MPLRSVRRFASAAAWTLAALGSGAGGALADPVPTVPSPSPSPAASPSPGPTLPPVALHRLRLVLSDETTYANGRFTGPGTTPPEAALFTAGSPVSPGVPYDFFTSSPTVTGQGLVHTLTLTPAYAFSSAFEASATLGLGAIAGNGNVAAYWGEQPLPALNPHLGQRAVTLTPQFDTANHARGDAVAALRGSVVAGAIGRRDGSLVLRGGWFDLAQSEDFVFTQPPQTNTPPAFGVTLPETLGDGPPALDALAPHAPVLPLQGVDLLVRLRGATTIEVSDAQLPQPPGAAAVLTAVSARTAGGNGASYGVEVARVHQSGLTPITVLFGGEPSLDVSTPPQAPLPVSFLTSQTLVTGGVRAALPLARGLDASLRFGISCYTATGTAQPSASCTSGSFTDAALHRAFAHGDLTLEALRFAPTYAPIILPYGTPENVWSVAYSWPGTWLKGTYETVDSTTIGPNREGLRIAGRLTAGGVELRAAYADYRQLLRYDDAHAFTPGFVEGFFLPQLGAAGTLGRETHALATLVAHPPFADVELDLMDVTLSRPASPGVPRSAVAMDYPGAALTLARQLGPNLLVSASAGRYATYGGYQTSGPVNADLAQRVLAAAVQYRASPAAAFALQYRLYATGGLPTDPAQPLALPAYHGPQILVEERIKQ